MRGKKSWKMDGKRTAMTLEFRETPFPPCTHIPGYGRWLHSSGEGGWVGLGGKRNPCEDPKDKQGPNEILNGLYHQKCKPQHPKEPSPTQGTGGAGRGGGLGEGGGSPQPKDAPYPPPAPNTAASPHCSGVELQETSPELPAPNPKFHGFKTNT